VNAVVLPESTSALEGEIVPPVPARAVTVYCSAKLAVTVQAALIVPVV
jgi:hypothetical protein